MPEYYFFSGRDFLERKERIFVIELKFTYRKDYKKKYTLFALSFQEYRNHSKNDSVNTDLHGGKIL
ncbi:hypothetical protein DQM68_16100 [Leptospira mayottensis]|uniref:Uncharacterized protein n=1 Tax=Leptospira mayottensis TaxID=1137606 RepID=A0ABN5NVF0_9LEPT|nr:hypothetical protein DQM68_16100 [Leptospira mayottensis]AXR65881.1 hypothetical protein DQM28_18435 [Leptospira mayottensis]AZQ01581.1 hypothetical protein LEP1GSC190_05620 [Leptospira mayottensis 200901116]